jgi:hypothetical protein
MTAHFLKLRFDLHAANTCLLKSFPQRWKKATIATFFASLPTLRSLREIPPGI